MRYLSRIIGFFSKPQAVYILISISLIFFLSKNLLPEGLYISGHDSGLALDSKLFLETRLYAWDERINFGEDNSLLFGSLTIHAFDYLSSLIAGVPFAGNQINIFFWLSLIFLAGFTFAYQLKQKLGRNFVYIFPYFILINFYIFQSIFILERAKYSLVSAALFFLAIIVSVIDKKLSIQFGAILSALLFSILNGGSWLGLPLYGGVLVILFVMSVFIFLDDLRNKKFELSLRFFSTIVFTGLIFILINSYSLFPYLRTFLKTDYKILQNTTTIDSNKAWLDYISQGSSFLNIFRMQGVPDWYETKFTPAPMHPFSDFYLRNPYLVVLSFLIPIGAFASLLCVRNSSQKKVIAVSSVIALISMIFMAASRSPWGFIYEFLYNNVPGFLIFRSSFYKFGYAFIIASSLMLAFTLSCLTTGISSQKVFLKYKNQINAILIIAIILSWLVYHQKLFNNEIFNWRENFSTEVSIPQYVRDYSEYVKNENINDGRVLLLPKLHNVWLSDGYDWGYWSLSTIHYSLTGQTVLSNSSGLNKQEREWVDLLYAAVSAGDAQRTESLAQRLGVTRFLLKMDALTGEGWSGGENPDLTRKKIESFNFLQQEKQFDKWILYKIKSSQTPLFSTENNLIELTQARITDVSPFLIKNRAVLKDEAVDEKIDNFIRARIDTLNCQSCVIEDAIQPHEFIWSRLLPNSVLFPLKLSLENRALQKISDPYIKRTFFYNLLLKRSAEVSSMFLYKTHDAYIIGSLKMIRDSINQVLSLSRQTSSPDNFSDAKELLDYVEKIKELLVSNVSLERSSQMSSILRDEISRTIWSIDQLKNYYAPVLDNMEQWSSEKVFEVDVKSLPYQLYLDKTSLSRRMDRTEILPEIIINDESIPFNEITSDRVDNWISLPSNNLKLGKNKLILKFGAPQNILKISENIEIKTPEGERKCVRGSLAFTPQGDTLLLKVKTSGSALKFFPKSIGKDELSEFLDWNTLITINDDYKDEYFVYHYPLPLADSNFYICGEKNHYPVFQEFIIQEIFKPKVIGLAKTAQEAVDNNKISYQRINPTKFKVNNNDSHNPYILVMNQRHSPSWRLKNSNGSKLNNPSFPIDLYATAWIIDPSQGKDFIVEYQPQSYFHFGLLTSVGAIIGLGVYAFIILRKKR